MINITAKEVGHYWVKLKGNPEWTIAFYDGLWWKDKKIIDEQRYMDNVGALIPSPTQSLKTGFEEKSNKELETQYWSEVTARNWSTAELIHDEFKRRGLR